MPVVRRIFDQATDVVETDHPMAAQKLRRASVKRARQMNQAFAAR